MRRFGLIASLLFSPATLQAQSVETGVYIMSQDAVEVAREAYVFEANSLADTVEFPSRGIRMESLARYTADYSPLAYTLDLYREPAEVAIQQVEVVFGDTAATWSTYTALGDSTGVTPLSGPYAFMQNLVFAHLAVVLLQYNRDVGGRQTLNVWMPEQTSVLQMEMDFVSGTEGTVQLAGTVMHVEVDESGWLRRATIPSQNVTVEWKERGATGS